MWCEFRKLGYIEYNGKMEIRNTLLNVVLYGKPEIRKKRRQQEVYNGRHWRLWRHVEPEEGETTASFDGRSLTYGL